MSSGVVELFRAVPLVVLMFLYYGLPSAGVTVSTFTAVVLGLTLYNGAVLAEISGPGCWPSRGAVRGRLRPRDAQVRRHAVRAAPPGRALMLPSIVSQLVVLLKDTALGFLITYPELLFQAQYLGSNATLNSPLIPVALVVAAIYIGLCLLLSAIATWLERGRAGTRPSSPSLPAASTDVTGGTIRPARADELEAPLGRSRSRPAHRSATRDGPDRRRHPALDGRPATARSTAAGLWVLEAAGTVAALPHGRRRRRRRPTSSRSRWTRAGARRGLGARLVEDLGAARRRRGHGRRSR